MPASTEFAASGRRSMAGEDALRCAERETIEVFEEVKDDGGDQENGVETVEEAAVAWECTCHVFDADVAFD